MGKWKSKWLRGLPTPTLPSLGLGLPGDSQHIWLYFNHPAPNCPGTAPAFLPSLVSSPS